MNAGMVGADPVVLRRIATQFDDAALQLMGAKGSIQPWVDMTNIWLGLNYHLFKDQWETTGARTIDDAASIFYHCAKVLRANARAQDIASAADGTTIVGTGLFSAPDGAGGKGSKTPDSTAEILDELHLQDPDSSDGIRIKVWVDGNNQKHAVVYINGTGQDAENGLFGWGDAIRSQFGFDTKTERAIRRAMADMGIDKNTKLMIAGYSQGGMHAQNIAASGDFGDVVVLSQGSPRTLKNNGNFTHISLNHPMDGVVNGVEVVTGQGIKRVQPAEGDGLQYTHTYGKNQTEETRVAAATVSASATATAVLTGNAATAANMHVAAGISSHQNMNAYKEIAQNFDSSVDPRAVEARAELEQFYNKRVEVDTK